MTLAMPQKKPATYQDILNLPEHLVGEIVDGELIVSPRPAFAHAHVASALGGELFGPFNRGRGGPGGWWILDEVELHLRSDILVPDVAGWQRARMPKPPSPHEPFMTLPPDWVCEVLSPSTAQLDRSRKLRIYAREEVAHVWMIDPIAHMLEVYRHEPRGWLLLETFCGTQKIRAEPFDAVELDLGVLWPSEG